MGRPGESTQLSGAGRADLRYRRYQCVPQNRGCSRQLLERDDWASTPTIVRRVVGSALWDLALVRGGGGEARSVDGHID